LIVGYIAHDFRAGPSSLRFLKFWLGFAVTVSPAVIWGLGRQAPLGEVGSQLSHHDWFHFCALSQPDDKLMLLSAVVFIPRLLLTLAAYHCIRRDQTPAGLVLAWVRAGLALCLLFTACELVAYQYVPSNFLFEVFVAVELRRALWIPAFFIIAAIIYVVDQRNSVGDLSAREFTLFFLTVGAMLPISWAWDLLFVSVLLLSIASLHSKQLPATCVACAIGIRSMGPLLSSHYLFAYSLPEFTAGEQTARWALTVGLLTVLVVGLQSRLRSSLRTRAALTLYWPLTILLAKCSILVVLRLPAFASSLAAVSTMTSQEAVVLRLHETRELSEQQESYLRLVRALRDNNLPPGIIVADPTIASREAATVLPHFLVECNYGGLSLYSLRFANFYDHRLRQLFGQSHGLRHFYTQPGQAPVTLSREFASLSTKALADALANQEGPAYVILRRDDSRCQSLASPLHSNQDWAAYRLK